MQLQLTSDELQFLLQLVGQWESDLSCEVAFTEQGNLKLQAERKYQALDELEDKIIKQDLRFSAGDLELLVEVVRRGESELSVEMARVDDYETQRTVISAQDLLKRIHHKICEACAKL